MAAVPALLNFAFDSTYTAGCYRIATRIQGSGDPYIITPAACTPFVPPTLSVPCVAQIPITVDDETCTEVIYEGYVQPCCQDEASLEGRVAFTVTFTPNPSCKSYDVTCDSAGIDEISVSVIGTGYTPGVNPPVIFSPPGSATAVGKVEDDGLATFSLTVVGAGGTPGTYTDEESLIGIGTPTANAFFDYVVDGTGVVTTLSLTSLAVNPLATGAGYAVGNTLSLPGSWSNPPEITVLSVYDGGQILTVLVTNPGAGYTAPPAVSIAAGGGQVAPTLSSTLLNCSPGTLGVTCPSGSSNVPTLFVGTSVQICRTGTVPAPPAGVSVVLAGCCVESVVCTTYTVTAAINFEGDVLYVDCVSRETEAFKTLIPGGAAEIVCALPGSIVVQPASQAVNVTIVAGGVCP